MTRSGGEGEPDLAELSSAGRCERLVQAADIVDPDGGVSRRVAQCAQVLLGAGAHARRRAHAFLVPGRIEVLGKHTDYAGGRSLLAAVERGFVLVATAREDDAVRFTDARTGESANVGATDAPPWAAYPRTVARRLAHNFPGAQSGVDAAFWSDLPPAAGLSSSSALVVGTFLVLDAVRGLAATSIYRNAIGSPVQLAEYLGAVENGWDFPGLPGTAGVGTHGGSEDHTAMLCAQPGHVVQFRFGPVTFETAVPMPSDRVFAVASSGVRAEKAGAALAQYNRLAGQTRSLLELWHRAGYGTERSLGAVLREHGDAVARLQALVQASDHHARAALIARLEQFAAECEAIIPAATKALGRGDAAGFGAQVARSSALGEHALGNQVPETRALVEQALALGADAASQFGAGFGGSVWAMVARDGAQDFCEAWRSGYVERFPGHRDECVFFVTGAGAGARRLA